MQLLKYFTPKTVRFIATIMALISLKPQRKLRWAIVLCPAELTNPCTSATRPRCNKFCSADVQAQHRKILPGMLVHFNTLPYHNGKPLPASLCCACSPRNNVYRFTTKRLALGRAPVPLLSPSVSPFCPSHITSPFGRLSAAPCIHSFRPSLCQQIVPSVTPTVRLVGCALEVGPVHRP